MAPLKAFADCIIMAAVHPINCRMFSYPKKITTSIIKTTLMQIYKIIFLSFSIISGVRLYISSKNITLKLPGPLTLLL